jgi:hypothetical protein
MMKLPLFGNLNSANTLQDAGHNYLKYLITKKTLDKSEWCNIRKNY